MAEGSMTKQLRTYTGMPYAGNAYCPRCWCNKGNDREQANARTEACRNGKCLCHDEEIEID